MTCNNATRLKLNYIFHMFFCLYCTDTKLYWNKITYIVYRLFHIDFEVDDKIILTGYDESDKSLILPNLMLIFAQYTIDRMYI